MTGAGERDAGGLDAGERDAGELESDRESLPAPGWEPLTEPFWREAGKGRLIIQRCGNCGVHRWPPAWVCYACSSVEWNWDGVTGGGTVYTYTWSDYQPVADGDPYCIAVVELAGLTGEPVRMATRLVDVARADVHCGMDVEVVFQPYDREISLPFFRPASGKPGGRGEPA